MKHRLKSAMSVLILAAGAAMTAPAYSETILRVGTWLPPTNAQNAVVWPTWAKWVEEATEGRVKVKIENSSGHPKRCFNWLKTVFTMPVSAITVMFLVGSNCPRLSSNQVWVWVPKQRRWPCGGYMKNI
tara:strand:+ start:2192 stop:2578 length:387 start_codon:yes stop_codon:yes gene_type:complete